MAFANFNVNNNEVGLPMEENNENEGSKLRLKEEPIDLDTEQKSPVIHSTAGDIRIACIYSGLETKIELENTNVQMNDKSMDNETLCKLEQRNPEDDCLEINSERKTDDSIVKTEMDEDIKPESNVKTESEEEDMEFDNEEEFLSGDEFLSDYGEDNENMASTNANDLSSSEDEDTNATNLDENLKKLVKFDNPILGDIIDIYKNYEELWNINKLDNLHYEKKKRLMQVIYAEIRNKLNITITSLDLEIILAIIHKLFSTEKKRRLKCELEQQEFASLLPNFYRSGFLEDHQGPFRCRNCNAIIKQFQQFQKHKSQHETNECDICGKVCKSKRSLKGHKRCQHNVVLYICALCDISFIDEKSLKYHSHFKHGKCEVCGKIFPSRNSMRQHFTHTHAVRDEKSLQCKVCGKISRNLQDSYNHKKAHSTVRYDCTICKKSFKEKIAVIRHMEYVHEGKRFPCKFCGVKEYSRPYALRTHLKKCKVKLKLCPSL